MWAAGAIPLAFLLQLGLGARMDLDHETLGLISETKEGNSLEGEDWVEVPQNSEYGHVARAMRKTVIPEFNADRKNCGDLPRIAETIELEQVEKSSTHYRVLVRPEEAEPLEFILSLNGKEWTSDPYPCNAEVEEEDSNARLKPDDPLVLKSVELLKMRTEAECGHERRFEGTHIWEAYLIGGTEDQHLTMFVSQETIGAILRKVSIEWSNEAKDPTDGKIISMSVKLCELAGERNSTTEYKEDIENDGSLKPRGQDARAELLELRAQTRERVQETRRAKVQRHAHEAANPLLPSYTGPLPKELDWRKKRPDCFKKGVVQDQGSCGSCWAFAALGALSDRHCIANGAASMTWKDGALKRFSVQDFLSCYKKDSKTGQPDGCSGGNLDRAFPMMMTKKFAFERHSPYTARCWQQKGEDEGIVNAEEGAGCEEYRHLPDDPLGEKPCKCWKARSDQYAACKQGIDRQQVQYNWGGLGGFTDLSPAKREELLMRIIYDGGPVAAGFRVWEDFRELVNRAPSIPYRRWRRDAKLKGGHAVVIAGWGEEADGLPFWWIRNSWGDSWALDGYCKFLRREKNAGIELQVAYPVVLKGALQTLDPTILGIRPAWKDEFAGKMDWGEIVDNKDGTFKVERDYNWKQPEITVKYDVSKMETKKDFYTESGFPAGRFSLLRVSVPFKCSVPCKLDSLEKYTVAEGKTKYRHITSQLNDDSWTEGWLHVDIDADDPINGKGTATIKINAKSPLRDQIRLRFEAQGVDWYKDVDGDYMIPEFRSEHTLRLDIPEHKAPGPEPRIFPFKVSFGKFKWDWGNGRSTRPPMLKLSIEATDSAAFFYAVKDASTGKTLVQGSCNEDRPSQWCWPSLGGSYSRPPGSDFQLLSPRGQAYEKTLLLELTAKCPATECGTPLEAKAQATYTVPTFRQMSHFDPFTVKINKPKPDDFRAGSGKNTWDMSYLWLSAKASGKARYHISVTSVSGKEIAGGKPKEDKDSDYLFVAVGGSSSFKGCPENLFSPGGAAHNRLIYIVVTATCLECYLPATATDKLLYKVPEA